MTTFHFPGELVPNYHNFLLGLFQFLLMPFAVSAVLTLGVERACIRLKLFDWPGERKTQTTPTPRMGGLAFTLTSLAIGTATSLTAPFTLIVGSLVVFAGGFADDLQITNSVSGKLCFQIPAALIFSTACDFSPLHLNVTSLVMLRAVCFGFLFFMTNAANLMDNMNGLTAGLCVTILWGISAFAFFFLHEPNFALLGILVGATVLGFCVRNFPRGNIYMGDQGSQFLGFFTSAYAIILWVKTASVKPSFSVLSGLILTFLLFLPFLYDVFSVVRIRLAEGRSPFVGDLCHISHRLVQRGFTPTQSVLMLVLLQALLTLLVIGLAQNLA